jgi:hypothetical protein
MIRVQGRTAARRCDDDDRAAANDRAHVVLNDPLAVVVERRGGLVEEKDTRVNHKCASNGDALALAARKVGAALLNHCVITLWKLSNEFVRAREFGSVHHHHARHRRIAKRAALMDRAVEQDVLLQDDADLSAQPAGIELGDVDPVDHHQAGADAASARDALDASLAEVARRRYAIGAVKAAETEKPPTESAAGGPSWKDPKDKAEATLATVLSPTENIAGQSELHIPWSEGLPEPFQLRRRRCCAPT